MKPNLVDKVSRSAAYRPLPQLRRIGEHTPGPAIDVFLGLGQPHAPLGVRLLAGWNAHTVMRVQSHALKRLCWARNLLQSWA